MTDPIAVSVPNPDDAVAHYNAVKDAVATLNPVRAYGLLMAIVKGENLNALPQSDKVAEFISNEGRPTSPHLEGLLREHFQAYLQRNQAERDARKAARSQSTGE